MTFVVSFFAITVLANIVYFIFLRRKLKQAKNFPSHKKIEDSRGRSIFYLSPHETQVKF